VKSINRDIILEGEIGYIGTSSAIHSSVPLDMSPLTTAQEARQFVEATAVDILAPAVGTMRGMLKSMANGEDPKHLDIPRIAEIKRTTGIFSHCTADLVLNPPNLLLGFRLGSMSCTLIQNYALRGGEAWKVPSRSVRTKSRRIICSRPHARRSVRL
jgi:hypothetical protein